MTKRRARLLLFVAALLISTTEAIVPGSASANEINQLQKNDTEYVPNGILYPQATETRDVRSLDGIWNFRQSPIDPEYGYRYGWYEQDLSKLDTEVLEDPFDDVQLKETTVGGVQVQEQAQVH